jgi:phospholipid/cholesterol/gamma-HCH transport system substrate-binding protein
MSRPRGHTLRRRLAGVVFVLVPVLLIWLAVAVYDKRFTASDPVVVETDGVGNQMHPGAEVKLRGVVVGEVRAIDATGRVQDEQERPVFPSGATGLHHVTVEVR